MTTDSLGTITAGYVISTVEAGRLRVYLRAMHRLALQVVVLLAVVLMPFGMAAASASPAGQHHPSATSGTEHCPDRPSKKDHSSGIGECTMPCSAALPAADFRAIESPLLANTLVDPAQPTALAGVVPEIATPPPRSA